MNYKLIRKVAEPYIDFLKVADINNDFIDINITDEEYLILKLKYKTIHVGFNICWINPCVENPQVFGIDKEVLKLILDSRGIKNEL